MNSDIQKDWLKIQMMCRDLAWITYGSDYKDIPELKEALKLLKQGKDKLAKVIEGD